MSNEYYKSNTTANHLLNEFNKLMNDFLYKVNVALKEKVETKRITAMFWNGLSLN